MNILVYVTLISKATVSFSKTIDNPEVVTEGILTIQIEQPELKPEEIVTMQIEEPQSIAVQPIQETPLTQEDLIKSYVDDICSNYYPNVDPALIKSIIYQESRYNPKSTNGNCLGLMQVSTKWHSDRAARLGVTDFYDPYGNILLGVDYISELITKHKDPALALMFYSMKHDAARKMYAEGKISSYAKTVLARAEEYKKGE
jgi:hypothetical protein